MLLKRASRLLTTGRWKSDKAQVPATVKSDKLQKVSKKRSEKELECVKECALLPKTAKAPAHAPLRSVNVAVMNSYLPTNHSLVAMLKLNGLIKEIRMYDENQLLHGTGLDVRQIDTSPQVATCVGQHQLKRALHKADIVVISAPGEPNDIPNSQEVFCKNVAHVKAMADACIAHCPDAVFIINAYPVDATVPLFAEILLKQGVFCPNRVLGSMALKEMRARTLASAALGMNPATVQVNVIGGGTPQTAVPVISGTKPGGKYLKRDFNILYKRFTMMTREVLATKKVPPTLSAGYALSKLVCNVAKGLCGKKHHPTSVFLRTSALFGVKYLSVPVYFGLAGVEQNLGLPALSFAELETLDVSLAELQMNIALGEAAAKPKLTRVNPYEHNTDEDSPCIILSSCANL
ncbi:malate dehydrogenase, mitochondrial-like isoform X2 [Rhodnius prolixus]|uniref:malate dehydrogenase, mitochondrial-like isoform X2 n=1 Tax=Rhodnius prolixus TaxID=13249 RepID=UPI003D18C2CA